jgi:hypothetical protein
MDDSYAELIRSNSDYKKKREDRYKTDSRDRLSKIIRKKIETTMIGALSSIEDHLGFLWTNADNSPLTEEQSLMQDVYQEIRSEILDKGNNQARNVDAELMHYDVEWLKYSMEIPVILKERPKKEGQRG